MWAIWPPHHREVLTSVRLARCERPRRRSPFSLWLIIEMRHDPFLFHYRQPLSWHVICVYIKTHRIYFEGFSYHVMRLFLSRCKNFLSRRRRRWRNSQTAIGTTREAPHTSCAQSNADNVADALNFGEKIEIFAASLEAFDLFIGLKFLICSLGHVIISYCLNLRVYQLDIRVQIGRNYKKWYPIWLGSGDQNLVICQGTFRSIFINVFYTWLYVWCVSKGFHIFILKPDNVSDALKQAENTTSVSI